MFGKMSPMRSISPDCETPVSLESSISWETAVSHFIRVEDIYSSPRAGSGSVPQFSLGILFPHVEVEDVVVAGPVICCNRMSSRIQSFGSEGLPIMAKALGSLKPIRSNGSVCCLPRFSITWTYL